MREILNIRVLVAVNLSVIVFVIVVAAVSFNQAQNKVASALRSNISDQHELLIALAILTDRNGADATVEQIVADCVDRAVFENLLVNLGSLSNRDLVKTQQLFDSCGDYFSVRKGFMVSRLEREYQAFVGYVDILNKIEENPVLTKLVEEWGILVAYEQDRGAFLVEQVTLQEEIITELIKGARVNSVSVSEKSNLALSISEQLQVTDQRIDALRSEIANITI